MNRYITVVLFAAGLFFSSPYAQEHRYPDDHAFNLNPDSISCSNMIFINEYLAPHIILVEKLFSRIRIYSTEDHLRELKVYICSTGKNYGEKTMEGDLRTPEGVYFFKGMIEESDLEEYYGKGAYALSYPNIFDRIKGKNGDGIWLHGTNDKERLKQPNNTKGCIIVSNRDIVDISNYIVNNKTPVIIEDEIEKASVSDIEMHRTQIFAFLDEWEAAWESMDIDRYMRFYSPDFLGKNMRRHEWRRYKEGLLDAYQMISVSINVAYILRFKEEFVVYMKQEYQSDRYADTGFKILYLERGGDGFAILSEEWYSGDDLTFYVLSNTN